VPNTQPFRAQLVSGSQQSAFEVWADVCRLGRLPSRSDFSPMRLGSAVAHVGLIDILPDLAFRFRLAGTRLREVYGRDPTGCLLADLAPDAAGETWRRVMELVARDGKPRCGAGPAPSPSASQVVVFWLRLPLSSDGRRIDGVLTVDEPVLLAEAPASLRTARA
jgi:hypothetical protein